MKLDVAIATFRPEGIGRVCAMQLPQVEGVRYVVSWQEHGGATLPQELMRSDMKIVRFSGKGLAANRNNALDHCSAEIVLIADDDLVYTPQQLRSVIRTMDANPLVDIASFQYSGDHKTYPADEAPITRKIPKGLTFTSFEVAIRQRCLNRLHYDERFGLNGTLYTIGEDDKLLLDAVRLGLNCRYFPITITSHTGPTTGFRPVTNPRTAQGMGYLIRGWYPASWPLRVPLKAYRLHKAGSSFWFCLRHLLAGATAKK